MIGRFSSRECADDAGEFLASVLDERAAPWCWQQHGDVVADPAAMTEDARPEPDPILEAYVSAPLAVAAMLNLNDAGRAVLAREAALRDAARRGADGAELALELLRSCPHGDPSSGAAYFARAACEARFRAWQAQGGFAEWPASPNPAFLRHEPELLMSLAQRLAKAGQFESAMSLFLLVPVNFDAGRLFFFATDAWLDLGAGTAGLLFARGGSRFFALRKEISKQVEMEMKSALCSELNYVADASESILNSAISHYAYVLRFADGPLLHDAVMRAFRLIVAAGPGGSAGGKQLEFALGQRDPNPVAEIAERILSTPGGGADPVQRAALTALMSALTVPREDSVRIPRACLRSRTLFSAALMHETASHPESSVVDIAAFLSGFANVTASAKLLRGLKVSGGHQAIKAISAFISRRYGDVFLRDGEIVAVIGCRNVGDTLLYMSGLAAFARAAKTRVYVYHRAQRVAVADLFRHVAELSLESFDDETELHPALGLNRIAVGEVAGLYEVPWYLAEERQRLTDSGERGGYIWEKILSVAVSGIDYIMKDAKIEPVFVRAPTLWDQAGRDKFAAMGLPAGKTVLIAPLANTLFSLTSARYTHFREFWRHAFSIFRNAGFGIAVNVINNRSADEALREFDVASCDLDLREIPSFLACAGFFAGVRSGLCDLVALAQIPNIQARTIYSRGAEHCVGLSPFGVSEVTIDLNQGNPKHLASAVFADWLLAFDRSI